MEVKCLGPNCDQTFTAQRSTAKYCSVACRVAALRKRREEVTSREPEAGRAVVGAMGTAERNVSRNPTSSDDMPVRKRYVRRRKLDPQPVNKPVEKWRNQPSSEEARQMAALARKVVLPEDPYEGWGDGPVIGAPPV